MTRENGLKSAKFLTRVALSAALMALSAFICIPIFVPVTLQVFALYFILLSLGGAVGFVSAVVYVFLGLVGLPVFSGFSGGVGALFLPAGGFIPGFVLAAAVFFLFEGLIGKRRGVIFGVAFSFLALYISGTAVLLLLYSEGGARGAFLCFLAYIAPYIIPDLIKIILAKLLSDKLGGILKK